MVKVNLELFEALKQTLNEDAARMIAEVVPQAEDLATTHYIDMKVEGLNRRIDQLESRMFRWVLAFFAPMWIAILAAIITLLLKS